MGEFLNIPQGAHANNLDVTLAADVTCVNGLPFLTAFSKKIRLITGKHLPGQDLPQLGKSLKSVFDFCERHGFNVKTAMMDN